jgi:hypothetical protein
MNLIERVKNILTTPKTEWDVISNESATMGGLLTSYVIPLSLLAGIGTLLKFLVFNHLFGIGYAIAYAIFTIVTVVITFVISTYVVDALAPSFGSEKDLNKSAQLVAYAGTAGFVAGLLSFIPIIGWILPLAGSVYGVYLFYLGLGPLKKTAEDKKVVYIIVYFVVNMIIYYVLISLILSIVLGAIFASSVTIAR